MLSDLQTFEDRTADPVPEQEVEHEAPTRMQLLGNTARIGAEQTTLRDQETHFMTS